jgi:hypothetical protein
MDLLIEIGQAYLKLDGIGVDALIIGFFVIGIIRIRSRMGKQTPNTSILNYGYP